MPLCQTSYKRWGTACTPFSPCLRPIQAPSVLHKRGLWKKRDAWEKVTPPWKKVTPPWKKFPTASIFSFSQIPPRGLMQQGDGQAGREQQMAGETNYDAGGGQPLLRKKYHVVRKKNHVVRKKVYVASVFAAPQAPPCGCCWPMMAGRCKPHGRRGPQHSCCGRAISSVYPLHRL